MTGEHAEWLMLIMQMNVIGSQKNDAPRSVQSKSRLNWSHDLLHCDHFLYLDIFYKSQQNDRRLWFQPVHFLPIRLLMHEKGKMKNSMCVCLLGILDSFFILIDGASSPPSGNREITLITVRKSVTRSSLHTHSRNTFSIKNNHTKATPLSPRTAQRPRLLH